MKSHPGSQAGSQAATQLWLSCNENVINYNENVMECNEEPPRQPGSQAGCLAAWLPGCLAAWVASL